MYREIIKAGGPGNCNIIEETAKQLRDKIERRKIEEIL